MKKFFILSAMIFNMTTVVLAQTSHDDAAYRAEFQKMAEATHLKQGFCLEVKTMLDQKFQNKLSETDRKAIVNEIQERVGNRYLEEACQMCKAVYSLEDLKQLNAFYATPTGAKMAPFSFPHLAEAWQQHYPNEVVEVVQKYLYKETR